MTDNQVYCIRAYLVYDSVTDARLSVHILSVTEFLKAYER